MFGWLKAWEGVMRVLPHSSALRIVTIFFTATVFLLATLAVNSQAAVIGFAKPVLYSSGGFRANSVSVGDFNGDGYPDLALTTGCTEYGCVGVLLGNGNGGFRPAMTYNSGTYGDALWLAAADVNEDAKLDLIVSGGACCYWYVSVLLGNGDGTFQNPVSYASGGYEAGSVAVGDVNGDGHPDLVVVNALQWGQNESGYGGVSVLLGNGDGTFKPAVIYNCGSYAHFVAIADLNGDGKSDLVITHAGKLPVDVLLGNSDGTLEPAVGYDLGGVGAVTVAIGDVNRDGKLDLVVANGNEYWNGHWTGTVAVLTGNGNGTFQQAVVYDVGELSANSVAIGDVNGDGKPDLLVATMYMWAGSGNGAAVILPGNGDGTFQNSVFYNTGPHHPWSEANSIAVADVNGDSKPDLLVTTANGYVSVLFNNFVARTTTTLASSLNPSFVGQSVTFIATVASELGVPDGQLVTFYDGTTLLTSAALAGGKAAYTTSSLSEKTHYIKAKYAGHVFEKPSLGSLMQVVNRYPSITTITSSLNPSIYGQTVSWTAKVTTSGPFPLTGTVAFNSSSAYSTFTVGTANLSATGIAIFSRSNLNVGLGSYPLTAAYKGDANNAPSTSPVLNQTVLQTTTKATLTSSVNPSTLEQAVTFTAKITSPAVLPTGPVTFSAGTTVLGTVQLSGGKATFTTSSLSAGSNAIKLSYEGNSNIKRSSVVLSQIVQ
jgi:hypothetical protein